MHWRIKATVQKVLGVLPGGNAVHFHLQRRFGGLRDYAREFELKFADWQNMVGHLHRAGVPITGSRLFEIGTGWYPTFPFACYLINVRHVDTVDLTRHLRPVLVRACVERLGTKLARIAEAAGVPEADVRERYRKLSAAIAQSIDLERATEGVVRYMAPADATRTDLKPASVDCVYSNSVLEHVPPEVIRTMYMEAMRILVPGGVMFHSVNCGDHYAYVDSDISQLNYLQYSDREWERWNNAFLYQNRLRAHCFVDDARECGFAIELDTSRPHEQRLRELAQIDVHPQFASLPPEVLCITSVDFIARKPGGGAAGGPAAA